MEEDHGTRGGRDFRNGRVDYSIIVQTVIVVGMVVGGIWAGVINPLSTRVEILERKIDDRVDRLASGMVAIEDKLASVAVTIREYSAFKDDVDNKLSKLEAMPERFINIREHEEFKSRLDQTIGVLKDQFIVAQKDIASLRDNQVTRSEHVTHWDMTKEDIGRLTNDIGILRRDFGGQYTVAEKIKDLQTQIEALQTKMAPTQVQLPQNFQFPKEK